LDEIDKLSSPDQLALLNLMENGKLTKTTKSESYEIDLEAWVFATANEEQKIPFQIAARHDCLAEYLVPREVT